MESRAVNTPQGEIGIVSHEGKEYSAWGAVVTDSHAVAYPITGGVMGDWSGKPIGTWRAVASWPVRSYIGPRMYQIEAVINGQTYTGRGFGPGMVWRGKAKASK